MTPGRKYVGKLAVFGERVLARLPTANGEDKFKVGAWIGKTNRGDFHMVATSDGLRWTRTIRRMPFPLLSQVKMWPWNVAFGQIGTKSSPLTTKAPGVALPPDMAATLRQEAQRAKALGGPVQPRGAPVQQALEDGQADGEQRQAGQIDEAASDPSSSTLKSSTSSSEKAEIDDDTLLADLMEDVQENKVFTEGVETERSEAEKRSGGEVPKEDQSPSKAMKESLRKFPKVAESSGSRPSAPSGEGAQAAGERNVRMVVEGQLLEDGDLDLDFPEKPPELDYDQLFEVDSKAADTELLRLIELGVLKPTRDVNLREYTVLQTKLVYDWSWRNDQWTRGARLVAKDFNWMDPNRRDCFAPAGGQSLPSFDPCNCPVAHMEIGDVGCQGCAPS
jgi:hypothetical protein